MTRHILALAFALLLAGCASVGPGATTGGNGGDAHAALVPAPLVNVSSTHTSRETSIAVSPKSDQDLFLCAPGGVPAVQNGESYFFASHDAGATWAEIKVETSPTDPRQATFEGGDCDVTFDAAGTMYAADISLASVSMGASRDGGKTWSGTPVGGSSPVADRPWLVGGPAGTVYLAYQDVQFGTPTMIWFVKSTDYGQTYSRAVPVVTPDPNDPYTWEGNLVVSPDGKDMALAYNRRNTGAEPAPTDQPAEDVFVATSHDGGATWTQHLVSHRPASASYLYPSLARDAAGGLHLVFAQRDGDKGQPVWYAYSGDQGATWSAPVPLSHGVGYSPWIAATPEGTAVVQWLGSPAPDATLDQDFDWYTYVAIVRGHGANVTLGTSTAAPIFHGKMGGWPEFNMVRLDSQGRILLGESVPTQTKSGVSYTEVFQLLNAPAP